MKPTSQKSRFPLDKLIIIYLVLAVWIYWPGKHQDDKRQEPEPDQADSSVSLRILAWGDSLTAGYMNGGEDYHPYADHLKTLIETDYPGANVTV